MSFYAGEIVNSYQRNGQVSGVLACREVGLWIWPELDFRSTGNLSAFGNATVDGMGEGSISTRPIERHWQSVSASSCFISVCPSVALFRQHMPKMCTLFCLVHIKKSSFLISCVFWFVFVNASSQLCFPSFSLYTRLDYITFLSQWNTWEIRAAFPGESEQP